MLSFTVLCGNQVGIIKLIVLAVIPIFLLLSLKHESSYSEGAFSMCLFRTTALTHHHTHSPPFHHPFTSLPHLMTHTTFVTNAPKRTRKIFYSTHPQPSRSHTTPKSIHTHSYPTVPSHNVLILSIQSLWYQLLMCWEYGYITLCLLCVGSKIGKRWWKDTEKEW